MKKKTSLEILFSDLRLVGIPLNVDEFRSGRTPIPTGFLSAYALGEGQRNLEHIDERENCSTTGEYQEENHRNIRDNLVAVCEAIHLENGMIETDGGLSFAKWTLLSVLLCDV